MRNARLWIVALVLGAGLAVVGRSPACLAQVPAAPETVEKVDALAPEKIPAAIIGAINTPDRSADDKLLDAGRRPAQIMAFFGVAPGMQVEDIFAGAGYTTEILARIVGAKGKVYSQNAPFPPRFKKIEGRWEARLNKYALGNVVAVRGPFDSPDLLPVPPGSLDEVLIIQSYHDLAGMGVNRDKVNAAVFKALKPGGIYGIVDHSAQQGSGFRDVKTLHRIGERAVIEEVEKAGFRLAATSSALRHPEDDRTWNVFSRRGFTDRFMLKFVKPR